MSRSLPQQSKHIFDTLTQLASKIEGDVRLQQIDRFLYAQDASIYSEEPIGVVMPKSTQDIVEIVKVANELQIGLIPRGGGTSLAGQCVGNGLVIDIGRYMNRVLNFDYVNGTVEVEPGVILDDLNKIVAEKGWMVGPDTSTSNRCMIGGMVGNNSCGSHSIYYGTTRDHILGLEVVMSDSSVEWIEEWDPATYQEKRNQNNQLGEGLRTLETIIKENAHTIEENYPRKDVVRRNSGYALDDVLFRQQANLPFQLQRILAGSEGTLAVTSRILLKLVKKPKESILVCVHFDDLNAALEATVEAVKHKPAAVELIDDTILLQTKNNLEQRNNRFFLSGDPAAILVIEFYDETEALVEQRAHALIESFQSKKLGYAYPIVRPPDDQRVWSLRKAGLGLLMGIVKKRKAIAVIEDTAVPVDKLPLYIKDFQTFMASIGQKSVYYAHASVGELHLRPELDLKDPNDVELMKKIAYETMLLVKQYKGSLSGEHGDGRVRGALLRDFYGEEIYQLLLQLKESFDPKNIFNPHKIVETKPIDEDLRFPPGAPQPEFQTYYDFSHDGGLLRSVEKCNGAGACRKKVVSKGTMCPSYRATLEERDSTRGRSNVFRHVLLQDPTNAFSSEELKSALDLCLSCKGCKSECPASVDMARLKSEFLQHYYDAKGTPLSAKLFGRYAEMSRIAAIVPTIANFSMGLGLSKKLMRRLMGVTPKRELPAYAKVSFTRWWKQQHRALPSPSKSGQSEENRKSVWLYVDPFINYTEPDIAIAAVELLESLGLYVDLFPIHDDGRTHLSKGLLREAKALCNKNLEKIRVAFEEYPDRPVIGIEPSALLTFVDEYPDLCAAEYKPIAKQLASKAKLLEDWLAEEESAGHYLDKWHGTGRVVLHGHCHQKSLVGLKGVVSVLKNAGYEVEELQTGCCGMAGSFGYEEAHYEVSMAVGEQVLFPALRSHPNEVVAASGTSCRHQIKHGVNRVAHHPIVLLAQAIR